MYFELCTATYARSHSSAQAQLSFGLTWCKMCTGLPVAGHGEWMAFLSLPRAEQDAHLQPQMQNMMQCWNIILAGNDDVPLPRAPPVCVKCNGLWLCKCAIIEYSHKCRRSRSRSRSRSISVFPAIAEIRALRESQDKKDGGVGPRAARPPYSRAARPPPAVAFPSEGGGAHVPGQPDWEAVEALLEDDVLLLERCKPMFIEALADINTSVWLPKDKDYVRHMEQVVASIPLNLKFKIGITVDPDYRYYRASYAYNKLSAQERDGVCYSGMIIVYVHPVRSTVAMFEVNMIDKFTANEFKHRCVNVKRDFDDHIRFDHSDEEKTSASGPHCVYIVYGLPGPMRRVRRR
jgi:hypothetical protein